MQKKRTIIGLFILVAASITIFSCTKYQTGFISPYFQYPLQQYDIIKGRVYTSDAINPDGSSVPFSVKIIHVYDSAGNVVDDALLKPYPVTVWTAAYDATADTTIDAIKAKQATQELPAISVNESNGAIIANAATSNLPAGKYSLDLQITNTAGANEFKNIVSFVLEDGPAFEATPELGSNYLRLIQVGNESSIISLPQLPVVDIEHTADEPNLIIVKMADQNGVPFNPSKGEIVKRPNTGLNPIPPYLQNLQDYTHSYQPTDSTMNFPFALLPMPYASLGNGYNMYYRISSSAFHADGYADDAYSLNIRFPVRFYEPGTYTVTITMPGITHR